MLKESRIFGCTVIADGATIDKIPLFNVIAASPNNPMAILDIFDLSESSARGETKDAPFLANKMKPLIKKLENEVDSMGNKHLGIADLAAFDGAGNVQVAGQILRLIFPRMTVIHGCEHATDLLFKDVYTEIDEFKEIAKLTRKVRNVFGSTRHVTTAMFRLQSKIQNKGLELGLLKPSECR